MGAHSGLVRTLNINWELIFPFFLSKSTRKMIFRGWRVTFLSSGSRSERETSTGALQNAEKSFWRMESPNFEFWCVLTEQFVKFLSRETPMGQKRGTLAFKTAGKFVLLSLRSVKRQKNIFLH